jgi:hypothetical protein
MIFWKKRRKRLEKTLLIPKKLRSMDKYPTARDYGLFQTIDVTLLDRIKNSIERDVRKIIPYPVKMYKKL